MTLEEIKLKVNDYIKLTNNSGNIIYCYKIIDINYDIDEYSIKLIYTNDAHNQDKIGLSWNIRQLHFDDNLTILTDEEKVELL